MIKTLRLRALTSAVALAIGAASATTATAYDLNVFRSANGRLALRLNASLTLLANAHAHDMARRGRLDHNGFFQQRGPNGARRECRLWLRRRGLHDPAVEPLRRPSPQHAAA